MHLRKSLIATVATTSLILSGAAYGHNPKGPDDGFPCDQRTKLKVVQRGADFSIERDTPTMIGTRPAVALGRTLKIDATLLSREDERNGHASAR